MKTKPDWRKFVVVVTGGIGAGKSTVVSMLREQGALVLSADEIVGELLEPGKDGYKQVVKAFGNDILDDEGRIARRVLAERVFAIPEQRKLLEQLLHPLVQMRAGEFFSAEILTKCNNWPIATEDYKHLLVYEVPLFFEVGYREKDYRAVILVLAERELRVARAVMRTQLPREDIEKRIDAQLTDEEKIKNATFVIWNNESLESLRDQVTKVVGAISSS